MSAPSPADFDCRHCGATLQLLRAAQSPIGYYRCPRCDRQFATPYPDALRNAARPHVDAPREDPEERRRLDELRGRLDRWLARAEGSDPYALLGLRPGDGAEEARERFHALALRCHPDRGGDADAMRRLIEAYDTVRECFARAAQKAPPAARPAPRPSGLVRREPASWARARAAAQAEAPEGP